MSLMWSFLKLTLCAGVSRPILIIYTFVVSHSLPKENLPEKRYGRNGEESDIGELFRLGWGSSVQALQVAE